MVNYLLLIVLHLLGDFYLQTTKVCTVQKCEKELGLTGNVRNVENTHG